MFHFAKTQIVRKITYFVENLKIKVTRKKKDNLQVNFKLFIASIGTTTHLNIHHSE